MMQVATSVCALKIFLWPFVILLTFSKHLLEYYFQIEPETLLSCFSFCFYDSCHYRAPGVDQIPLKLIQASCKTLSSDINELFPVRNKQDLQHQWRKYFITPEECGLLCYYAV
jgi:hypothetical protein